LKLKRLSVLVLTSSILSAPGATSQNKPTEVPAQTPAGVQQASAPVAPRPALVFGLAEDTPVRLKITETVSSGTCKLNDRVAFEVVEDVKVKDVIVIQHGARAIATVTEAQPKRRMGRSGKLNMNIDSVELVDGEKVNLRAVKGGSGGSHTGAMTGAMVATGILFFPAAPLFLFMHGKDITIPKGTEINAFVAADTPLEVSKFAPIANTATATDTTPATADPAASVTVKSNPDSADITVDGKYVGTTQSILKLAPGDHTITMEKAGFKQWQRVISVAANATVNVEATMEKMQ
jgi:hypothetical protein